MSRICLRIMRKSWGIMGDNSGKFLKEFLEVFEELLAHAYLQTTSFCSSTAKSTFLKSDHIELTKISFQIHLEVSTYLHITAPTYQEVQ